MEVLGIRLVGVNSETGQKLLLTVGFVLAVLLLRATVVWISISQQASTGTTE